MFSALFSFIGGSAFRMVWGEVSAWLNKKLEHQQELDAMRLQAELEAARHERDMARLKLQSDLGIKEIQIAGDAAVAKSEADAFLEAMKTANKPTGIAIVDAWNGIIRPSAATISLALWIGNLIQAGFALVEWDRNLVGAILGYFFADRSLAKRAK